MTPAQSDVDDEADAKQCRKEGIAGKDRIIAIDGSLHWTCFGYRIAVERVDMGWVDSHI
jgi:hypothetical protein